MHPDIAWLLYQTDVPARHPQVHARHGGAAPRRHRAIAVWSGQHLLRLAHWLLRVGHPSEQRTLTVRR